MNYLVEGVVGSIPGDMIAPRSAFGAPPQGALTSGPAKPVPRRPLDGLRARVPHVGGLGVNTLAAPPAIAASSDAVPLPTG